MDYCGIMNVGIVSCRDT